MKTELAVLQYLLQEKFVKPSDVLNNLVTVESFTSNNFSVIVRCKGGDSLLIKQNQYGTSPFLILNEIKVYSILHSIFPPSSSLVPKVIYADKKQNILILEYLTNHVSFDEILKKVDDCPKLISKVSLFMRDLHSSIGFIRYSNQIKKIKPWIFTAHLPDKYRIQNATKSYVELTKIIQQNSLICKELNALSASWSFNSFIHGDIKADNLLVNKDNKDDIRFIDWELSTKGDSDWDIGCVIAIFILLWIDSMPFDSMSNPKSIHSSFSFEKAMSLTNEFLHHHNHLNDELSPRIIKHCAIRLIQRAFEESDNCEQINLRMLYCIQIAENLLKNPYKILMSINKIVK